MREMGAREIIANEGIINGTLATKVIYRDMYVKAPFPRKRSLRVKDRMLISKRRLENALKRIFLMYIGFWVVSIILTVLTCLIFLS